eukprot:6857-Heterococcus_DN1.PRE.3
MPLRGRHCLSACTYRDDNSVCSSGDIAGRTKYFGLQVLAFTQLLISAALFGGAAVLLQGSPVLWIRILCTLQHIPLV